jgi:hypothetical protein
MRSVMPHFRRIVDSHRLRLSVCLSLLIPASAGADHICIDGWPMGRPVAIGKAFPDKWFMVGSAHITDPKSHVALKDRFKNQYITSYDEGPVGSLCLKWQGEYVAVTTSDYGPGVQYSVAAPKCLKCEQSRTDESEFRSGTGLRLGQTKKEVSGLLQVQIESDLTDVTFEDTEVSGSTKTLHTEALSLEFQNDRLVRFSVYDFREGA